MESIVEYRQDIENGKYPYWLENNLRPYYGILKGKTPDEIVEFFDSFEAKPASNAPERTNPRSDRRRSSMILLQLVRDGVYEYVGDHPKMYRCEHGVLSRTEALMDARRLHGNDYRRAYAMAEGK